MTRDGTGYTIVVPSRHGSSRFPGKPLHPLGGRPMILHVLDRARESSAARVVVATDDERIASVCRAAGADVAMTSREHPSGTDRIAEVARTRGWAPETVVVGLQGDEPATPPERLDALAADLVDHPGADLATFRSRIRRREDWLDPMRVKVVTDAAGMALYFSRAPIPWRRDAAVDPAAGATANSAADFGADFGADSADAREDFPESWVHVGLYAYRCGFLGRYAALEPSTLEAEEQLEQLRVLHHGGRIHVGIVDAGAAHGVDVPGDVPAAELALRAYRGRDAA